MSSKQVASQVKKGRKAVKIQLGTKKQPPMPAPGQIVPRKRFSFRTKVSHAPMAIGYSTSVSANLHTAAGNATLVSREIFQVTSIASGLSYELPITPTKWTNTRTAQLAGTYTDFRPLKINITWLPSIGTNTAGSVAIGTYWSGARIPSDVSSFDALGRALAATNGGFITTAWKPMKSRIALGRNLRANNYPMYDVGPDDIPLWIVVASDVTAGTAIGTLIIDMQVSLKNPITAFRSAPVSAVGTGTIVEDSTSSASPKPRYLEFDKSIIGDTWTPGDEFFVTSGQNITNDSGSILNYMLQPLIVRASTAAAPTGKQWFDINQLFKVGQSLLTTFIGRTAQSFL